MEEGNRKAGAWLKEMIETPPKFEILRYLSLIRLVCSLYIMRAITRRTYDKFADLISFYLHYKELPVGSDRDRTKELLGSHWCDVLGKALNALAYDEKIGRKLDVRSTEKLCAHLNHFEIPKGLAWASLDSLRGLINIPFYYDKVKQELLYVVEERGKDEMISVVKCTDLKQSDDLALKRGSSKFFGVSRIEFDEEKDKAYMEVPDLHGVISYSPYLTLFLYERSFVVDESKGNRVILCANVGDEEGPKIGGFNIVAGELVQVRARRVTDGLYDFNEKRMKNPDVTWMQGTVVYDSSTNKYIIRMPDDCDEATMADVIVTFALNPYKVSFEFYPAYLS